MSDGKEPVTGRSAGRASWEKENPFEGSEAPGGEPDRAASDKVEGGGQAVHPGPCRGREHTGEF